MNTKSLLKMTWKLSMGWCLMVISATAGHAVEGWVQRYGHTAGSADRAIKVVTDTAGNVIVAGWSGGGQGVSDYATIKYSGAGVPLWTNRYNGPLLGDFVSDLAVDGSGNVFVTGYTYHDSDFFADYATIKYSGNGVPLWTNLYDEDPDHYEMVYDLAVDGEGNVVVTGHSYTLPTYDESDYLTIKYSAAVCSCGLIVMGRGTAGTRWPWTAVATCS